jgi:uncharacterized protein (DUF4415 family)
MKKRSRTDWAKVDALTDDQIDYSDIPEQGEEFFKAAQVVLPQAKAKVSIRLDSQVVDFFKTKAAREGGRYQSWINAVLKEYVKANQPPATAPPRRAKGRPRAAGAA